MLNVSLQQQLRDLRIHDLIAKLAHVRLKDSLRVLLALSAVAEEYGLPPDDILAMAYSAERPTPPQAKACERTYWWMYDNERVAKLLYQIEQLN